MTVLNRSINSYTNGVQVSFGAYADSSALNIVWLSETEARHLVYKLESTGLPEEYIIASVLNEAMTQWEIAEKAWAILTDCVSDDKLQVLKSPNELIVIGGLELNAKYMPISYSPCKAGYVLDRATVFAALFTDALLVHRNSVPVRVPGTHQLDKPQHYVSVVNQVLGNKGLNSGAVADFLSHGDGDGFIYNSITDLYLTGQIMGKHPTPTVYSNWQFVRRRSNHVSEFQKHLDTLRSPIFLHDKPDYVGNQDGDQSIAVPVLSNDDCTLRIHPTSRVAEGIGLSPRRKLDAEAALVWIHEALLEASISVVLKPFQTLIMPNRLGKHAVPAKILDDYGLTDRQFIRIYGSSVARPADGSRLLILK